MKYTETRQAVAVYCENHTDTQIHPGKGRSFILDDHWPTWSDKLMRGETHKAYKA